MSKRKGIYAVGGLLAVSGAVRIWLASGGSVQGVSSFGLLLLLILLGISDARTMSVESDMLTAGVVVGVMVLWVNGQVNWLERLLTVLITILIIGCLSHMTRGGIGMGDGFVMALIGLFTGWQMMLLIAVGSLFAAGVTGVCLMLARGRCRQMKLPFVPFLMGVYWLWLIF